jgi:hypothetical protein
MWSFCVLRVLAKTWARRWEESCSSCKPVSLSLPSLSLSVYLSLSIFLCLSLSLSFFLCLFFSLSFSISFFSLFLSLSLSLSLTLWVQPFRSQQEKLMDLGVNNIWPDVFKGCWILNGQSLSINWSAWRHPTWRWFRFVRLKRTSF